MNFLIKSSFRRHRNFFIVEGAAQIIQPEIGKWKVVAYKKSRSTNFIIFVIKIWLTDWNRIFQPKKSILKKPKLEKNDEGIECGNGEKEDGKEDNPIKTKVRIVAEDFKKVRIYF